MLLLFPLLLACCQALHINLNFPNNKVRAEKSVPFPVIVTPDTELTEDHSLLLEFACKNPKICTFHNATRQVDLSSNDSITLSLSLLGIFIGQTIPTARIIESNLSNVTLYVGQQTKIIVMRSEGGKTLSSICTVVLIILVATNTFVMGTQLEWNTIVKIVKIPIGLIIGFCCQYVLMPLLGFLYANLFLEVPSYQFGYFVVSCSPGGGLSNFWTILLDGNLDLSVTMTFFSNIFGFALVPMWVYTLGRQFYGGTIEIPFMDVLKALLVMVVSAASGMLLVHFKPNLAARFEKILKILTFIVVLIAVPFGLYANLYVFKLVTWQIIVCGFLLPWTGYLASYFTAYILKQQHRDCRTIAVETGIQNAMIAMLVCRFSLPEPDSDLTIIMPVCVFLLTSLPLWLCLAILKCYTKHEEKTNPQTAEMT